MTRPTVEMAFGSSLANVVATGGTWTDTTQYTDIVNAGISITRGGENETGGIQAGTLTLRLDNSDGRFTPTNTSSPYSPNVVDAVPVRVSVTTVTTNFVRNPSFEGDSMETWEWRTGVNVSTVATPVQSGTRAARVDWNASASDYFQTTVYGLTVGATYTASAYVRVPTGDVAVQVRMGGTDSSASAVNDAYTRLTVTFTATASVMVLQVIPSTTPAAGDLVYVDAVQVEAGASATTFDATAAQLHARFFGLVNQWPVQWEGLYATATITATDVFAVLSRAEDQMRPMLVQETLLLGPDAYYPMDEGSGSTSAGDEAAVGGPLSLATVQAGSGGTLAFAEGTAPLGMAGAPLFTPASASAGKYLQASLGSAFQDGSFTQQLLAETWFATSTAGRTIFSIASADRSYYLSFYLATATGFLTVESKQPSGSAVTTTAGAVSLADGALHHLIFDAEVQELYVDGVSIGSFGGILAVQDLATLTVGAGPTGATLWSGSISNVALYLDTSMSATNLAGHYTCGTTGYSGETATVRAFRLVNYLGLDYADAGTFSTGIAEQAALGSTCLDHLQDVEATESGKLYANRDSPGVTLQGRSVRYNPTSALTIVYADFEPGDFELAYDTQKLVNTVLVSRPGGATQRLVDAASKAARGPVGKTIDTLCTTDLVTTDLANWTLARYANPHPELRGVHIEAYSMGTATYRTLMAADISTVFTVTTLPAQAPASSMQVTVEGYTETIRHNQHDLTFHTSTTVTDTVWVLDDATYSVLGSTTRLAY